MLNKIDALPADVASERRALLAAASGSEVLLASGAGGIGTAAVLEAAARYMPAAELRP
ncbi:MAG: hypothetical protein U1E35_08965 [Rhodospirillales bacterium]